MDTRTSPRWSLLSTAVFLFGIGSLAFATMLFVPGARQAIPGVSRLGDEGETYSGPETATGFGDPRHPFRPLPTATPLATPASRAPVARISIPQYGVEAQVVPMGLDADGVMESPDDPWTVAWYDFTAHPGTGSNAVFSGHVDWTFGGGPGPAVFWHLKDLEEGDVIEVALADGTRFQYHVFLRRQIDPNAVDPNTVVGPTPQEIITLITCGGTFNRETRHYDQRVVVQAERIAAGDGQSVLSR